MLRQVLHFVRRNPHQASRGVHSAGEFVKRRTGGRYDRQVDKATGAAVKYLGRQRHHGRGRDHGGPYRGGR
ncbi:hypothetical protein HDA32_001439 [Spinactinospora alkalitolerans]|uniref:Antitoxin n=1 Tax=Spinactinospora alkalitolerans TaxID=687207 RepID=A0A852TQR5_9ACTN|nr:antitoxin [Spinactinospora alkalitolerans]NYE46319.1 hypothetical protein [Spinactinospora alkalitolerans]